MRPRFFLPDLDDSGRGTLDQDESNHLTRVLRLGVGEAIDVFDGRGTMRQARVVAIERRRAIVEAGEAAAAAAEPAVHVTAAIAVLKGDKMDAVIRDLAMMGAAAIQPVVTERSEIRVAALTRSQRVERWRRIAVGGVKQSGRAVVPSVAPPLTLDEWLASDAEAPLLAFVEPSAGAGVPLRQVRPSTALRLLVGPEGGWSERELSALAAVKATCVVLGARTLRADAMPLVAMASVFQAWNGW